MKCHEAIAELMRSIDTNAQAGDEARAHLRECERCRTLLISVSEQAPAEDVEVDSSTVAAEAAVVRERKKLTMRRTIGILAAIIVFGLLMLIPLKGGSQLGRGEYVLVVVTGIFMAILVGAPVLLLFSLVASAKTPKGDRRFYRRLGPGKWIDGICLGIAEAMGWSVTLVRIAFVLAFWFKGVGLLAYIVCAFAMPVHPADRQYLLRFKIARTWRRMRNAPDDAPQIG